MKTNVNMVRKMGDFNVTQQTKDGFFNATELLNQWNKTSGQKKSVNHFLENKQTSEFIDALKADSSFKDSEKPDNQVIK